MEEMNFVGSSVVRLPPGFRFKPTDEELVVHYLKRKVFLCPLPASIIIPEIDVCKFDPWDLPGDLKQERYFFSIREAKYPKGNRPNRATGSGYWKATGSDKKIVVSRSNQVVGMKKVLFFYRGKTPNGCRTDWIMHEYRVSDVCSRSCIDSQRKTSTQNSMMQMEDWVLCRIFLKKRSAKHDVEITQRCNKNRARNLGVPTIGFTDFMESGPSSSESSSITEISSPGSRDEEESSCNSLSSPSL